MYFSSKGFSFAEYYRKAVLATEGGELSGKAAFLLGLADSLANYLSQRGYIAINLHRHPELAKVLDLSAKLPQGWHGVLYFSSLHLGATPHKAVYAESNRLKTETYYELYLELGATFHRKAKSDSIKQHHALTTPNWQKDLLKKIIQIIEQ
ncbi:MAG: hypothetical protein NZ933_08990 [Bacteroidia bacterium]|nr:hypothetical protein [Bacteroidia bacterium]